MGANNGKTGKRRKAARAELVKGKRATWWRKRNDEQGG